MLLTIGNLSNHCALITPDDLKTKDNLEKILKYNEEHPFTHYMVCETNRLRIRSQDIIHKKDYILFTVMEQRDEFNWDKHKFGMPLFDGDNKLNNHQLKLVGSYNGLKSGYGSQDPFMAQS